LASSDRWSEFWADRIAAPDGQVELGEVFTVHRGQVTGNNALWTYGKAYHEALPHAVLKPCITRARELFDLGTETLDSTDTLKRIIDVPTDWERRLRGKAAADVGRFLDWCERQGGRDSYIAAHRQPWYSVRLGRPAPVLMTYMARRPPRFVLNAARAGILNIAHGLFPRADLAPSELRRIVWTLNHTIMHSTGRAYAGNLIKFEPSDAMRLRFRMPAEAGV
jgi:adenine-specific DNA-methyltransferase